MAETVQNVRTAAGDFLLEEEGVGVVEIILILVVIDTIQQPIILC